MQLLRLTVSIKGTFIPIFNYKNEHLAKLNNRLKEKVCISIKKSKRGEKSCLAINFFVNLILKIRLIL